MAKKMTDEQIKEMVEKEGYKLSNITRRKDKKGKMRLYIIVKCKKNHEMEMIWDNFKKGKRCKICSSEERGKKCRLTEKTVKERVEERGYEFISTYFIEKGKRIIKIKCNKGHTIDMKWNDFISGNNCGVCNGTVKHKYEDVKTYIEDFGYELLSNEYKNNFSKLKIKCDKGHEYKTTFSKFQQGRRCPHCANNIRYTYEYVKEYIESFGYELLSKEYVSNSISLTIKCPNGHITNTLNFNNFKNKDNRCSVCKESKGEKKINRFLNELNIKYIPQYKFDDCKSKRHLPFDFYLPDYNVCIEYDGEQHFEIVEHFGGLDSFIDTKIRDTIKNEYCKKNNIKLIRIPYWEFDNIEEILKHELEL